MVISKMRFFFFIFLILSFFTTAKTAYSADLQKVKAELIFASSCLDSETGTVKGAVKFTIPEGMHTYWKFAGQTGEPTDIRISTVPEANVSEIEWQIPEIFNNFGFYEIIYSQKAWHFFDINLVRDSENTFILDDNMHIDADVTFLQCSNVCEPRQVHLSAELPICKAKSYESEFQKEYELVATPQQEEDILKAYKQLTSTADKKDNTKDDNFGTEPDVLLYPVDTSFNGNLWQIILIAFLGGIILNFMPCVLPLVSVKLMNLTKARNKSIKKESLWYGFGIIFSFLTVWFFISLIRAGGESLGWGFQLQNPSFVLFLFALLLLLGMIFSGLVIVPAQLTKFIRAEQSAFASGVLAVFLASPCVAPFMGTAVAYALTYGGAGAFLVFFFLGLGLAFPFMLLAFFDGWIKYLPKTKRWNTILEKVLSIPLYVSAVWLLGVIYAQTGEGGLIIALFVALVAIIAAVLRYRVLWIAAIGALTAGMMFIHQAEQPKDFATSFISWQEYSPEALSLAVSKGNPVFVDFTAKWCLTCLVNERLVLEIEKTADLFAAEKVIAMKADFTLKDENIANALTEYGATGVPLYVYYSASKDEGKAAKPIILPQILTFDRLQQAIKEDK